MNAQFVSIDPSLDANGAFFALSYRKNAAELLPVPLAAGENPFQQIRVFQSSMTTTAAASLNLGSIFSASASYNSRAFIYEVMLCTEKFATQPVGDLILATRWGAGLRLALNVTDLKASGSLGIGMIAATVQLGQATALYELSTIGVADPAILAALPGPSDFNFDTYQKILDAAKVTKDFMANHTASLTAYPFAVSLTRTPLTDRISQAHAVAFAMRRIAKRRSLADALGDIGARDIDTAIVRQVYSEFASINNDADRPSSQLADSASDWLGV